MKYYKFLTREQTGEYSGFDYTDYLPTDSEPGPWLPEIPQREIELCEVGYHACKVKDLITWLNAELYEVELGDVVFDFWEKVVSNKIRLVRKVAGINDKTLRLFAIWCARRALALARCDPDPRSVNAVDVAERYANGDATCNELDIAMDDALDAAMDAYIVADTASYASSAANYVSNASRAAARAAANVADIAKAAQDAAKAAVSATCNATNSAAGAAERKAQTYWLMDMIGE